MGAAFAHIHMKPLYTRLEDLFKVRKELGP